MAVPLTHHAIALPPPVKPLPLLPPLILSLSTLFLQNLRPITEALLTRHLRTRTKIRQLSITPFRGWVRGVRLSDKNSQLLLTADELSISTTRKKQINFEIAANGITLHADINPVDWNDSNWTNHLSQIATSNTTEQDTKEPDTNAGEGAGETQVPKGWFAVSLSTQETAIHIVKPSLTLSIPPLVIPSTDLSSISAIHRLIDGLLGRAARDAGTRSFPGELRMGARRAARSATVKAVDKIFADAGRKVSQWRRNVDEVREFVRDVPDIDGAQKVMKDVGGALRSLENFLTREEKSEKRNTGTMENEVEEFRELEEEDLGL